MLVSNFQLITAKQDERCCVTSEMDVNRIHLVNACGGYYREHTRRHTDMQTRQKQVNPLGKQPELTSPWNRQQQNLQLIGCHRSEAKRCGKRYSICTDVKQTT